MTLGPCARSCALDTTLVSIFFFIATYTHTCSYRHINTYRPASLELGAIEDIPSPPFHACFHGQAINNRQLNPPPPYSTLSYPSFRTHA